MAKVCLQDCNVRPQLKSCGGHNVNRYGVDDDSNNTIVAHPVLGFSSRNLFLLTVREGK